MKNTNVYKLSYESKIAAEKDLLAKGVLLGKVVTDENDVESVKAKYAPITHTVVYLGNIPLVRAELDIQGNVTKEAVISPRYHVDVMTDVVIDFGDAEENIPDGQGFYHTF